MIIEMESDGRRVPLVESSGKLATCPQTLGNVVVSILGTGALGLPYAFRIAGWLPASISLLLIAIATYYCMILLVQCRKKFEEEGEFDGSAQAQTLSDVSEKAFGVTGRRVTQLLILIFHVGGSVAFFIFMGQNLSTVFTSFNNAISAFSSPSMFIVTLLLPLEIALSFIHSFSLLSPFSHFATFCNVSAMVVVIREDLKHFDDSTFRSRSAYSGAWTIPFACGVASFCFDGIGMTLPLEGSMAKRRMFPWVLLQALLGIATVYVCFGAFGYMAYGEATEEIATLNLPDNWSGVIVKVGLSVALAFTFPIAAHPIYEIIEMNLRLSSWYQKLCKNSQARERFGSQVARLSVVGILVLLSISAPGFVQLISFTGSTVSSLISFVLPTTLHLKLLGSSLNLWQRLVDYFLLFFGLAFASYGTYRAISGQPLG